MRARVCLAESSWGGDNPPIASGKHFGGYFSGDDRQQAEPMMLKHKWENAATLDADSWGFNRKVPRSLARALAGRPAL